MKERKNVLLADCDAGEVSQFASQLFFRGERFEAKQHVANWKRTGKWSEFKRYFMYFFTAFRYFLRRRQLGVIAGWQQFYALIFCFFCELFSVKKSNVVIALNFTYKEKQGRIAKLYRWFMGKCVSEKYLDFLHVPSKEYAQYIYNEFGFPVKRIIVSTFGVKDRYEELNLLPVPEGYKKDQYALAIGRSNRDYDFLISAWGEIDFPLVIISDTYQGKTTNENITILRNVAGAESEPWIANCGLMVLPIDDGTICSGDTVLLTAMSLKRKIVVTKPSTLAEMYVSDGKNAVLAAKIEEQFRQKVKEVLLDDKYRELGESARRSFLDVYTIESMGKKVTDALAKQNLC